MGALEEGAREGPVGTEVPEIWPLISERLR